MVQHRRLSNAETAYSVILGALARLVHDVPPFVDRSTTDEPAIQPARFPAKLTAFSALLVETETFDHGGLGVRMVAVKKMLSPGMPTSEISRFPRAPEVR